MVRSAARKRKKQKMMNLENPEDYIGIGRLYNNNRYLFI